MAKQRQPVISAARYFAGVAVFALAGCKPTPPLAAVQPPAALHQPEARLRLETTRFCERTLPNTVVNVKGVELPIAESNEKGILNLTFSGAVRPNGRRATAVLGTTEVAFNVVMTSQLHTLVTPDAGGSCSRVELDVVVSMLHHVVHVAREFKPGTCAYEKVREHEYLHVNINNAALHEAAAELQREMRQYFGRQVFYGEPATLHGQLRSALEAHWAPRLQELKNEVLQEHEEIDSAEEYASNQTDCEGEIPRILQEDPRLREVLERKR